MSLLWRKQQALAASSWYTHITTHLKVWILSYFWVVQAIDLMTQEKTRLFSVQHWLYHPGIQTTEGLFYLRKFEHYHTQLSIKILHRQLSKFASDLLLFFYLALTLGPCWWKLNCFWGFMVMLPSSCCIHQIPCQGTVWLETEFCVMDAWLIVDKLPLWFFPSFGMYIWHMDLHVINMICPCLIFCILIFYLLHCAFMFLAVILATYFSCPVASAGFKPGQGFTWQRNKNGMLVICWELYYTECAERSATHRECMFISKL